MLAVEVVKKGFQGFLTVGPEDEGVIHVPPPDFGFQWGRAQDLLGMLAMMGDRVEPMAARSICS